MDKTAKAAQFENAATLSLKVDGKQTASLFLLLQSGFFIKAEVGCTIEDFFLNQLNLSPDYIRKRIQGIFLNGKPADHIDTAIVRDGARLTLSGTMPGLAGMSLRSGPLAVFRHGITHRETGDYNYSGAGFIQLKLLNLLMADMGPALLQKGIIIQSSVLADYLGNLSETFWQGCETLLLNGNKITPEVIQKGKWVDGNEMVRFSVIPA